MTLLIVGFMYIFLSYQYRNRYNTYIGLLIILLVMGLQSNVPGDYDRYQSTFNLLSTDNINIANLRTEKGWIYLNLFFAKFGSFQLFVFTLSFIEYFILAKFIRNYTDSKYKFLAGLLFYFSINMMLFQMKGLRQALAVELCLLALMAVDKMNVVKGSIIAFILILISSTMHISAWLMVPFVIGYYFLKNGKILNFNSKNSNILFPSIVTGSYIALYIFKSVFIDYIKPIMMGFDLMGYEGYFGEMDDVTYNLLITLYGAVAIFSISYALQYSKGFNRYLCLIAIVSYFLDMLFMGMGNLFRLTLYINIVTVVVLPNTASIIYKNGYRVLAWGFAFMTLAYAWRTFITQTIRNSVDGFDNYMFLFELI